MGGKLGTIFARAGHDVVFSYSHSDEKLERLGDDAASKEVAAGLIRDAGFDPVDAGPLRVARYSEPFALLVAQLAYEGEEGPELAYRFERWRAEGSEAQNGRSAEGGA